MCPCCVKDVSLLVSSSPGLFPHKGEPRHVWNFLFTFWIPAFARMTPEWTAAFAAGALWL